MLLQIRALNAVYARDLASDLVAHRTRQRYDARLTQIDQRPSHFVLLPFSQAAITEAYQCIDGPSLCSAAAKVR